LADALGARLAGALATLEAVAAVDGATDGADGDAAAPPEHAAIMRLASRTSVVGRARRMANLGDGSNAGGV
jgi:hypothetical protein